MIIFSRRIPWLLGTTILGNHPYLRKNQVGEFDDVLILNRSPGRSCFLKCLKTVEKLKFAFISIWKFMKNETAPHPSIFHQTGKKKIIFSAFLKRGYWLRIPGGVKVWYGEHLPRHFQQNIPTSPGFFCCPLSSTSHHFGILQILKLRAGLAALRATDDTSHFFVWVFFWSTKTTQPRFFSERSTKIYHFWAFPNDTLSFFFGPSCRRMIFNFHLGGGG